jgi:FkbM family methyltransferase
MNLSPTRLRAARKRAARGKYFDRAGERTPLLAVDSEHGRLVVSTADKRIGRSLFIRGRYALEPLRYALERVDRDGVFLDIGANIGTVALAAVRNFDMARAVAFEPHPDNVRLLRANVALNDLDDRVRVVACALSDQSGVGSMRVHGANSGGHRLASGGGLEVPLRRLDDVDIPFDDVRLAWMDVQGHEPNVIDGASELLRRQVPMVVEFHPGLLRKCGTYERMIALISEHFSEVVDIRRKTSTPASGIGAVAEGLGTRFTDLLLIP